MELAAWRDEDAVLSKDFSKIFFWLLFLFRSEDFTDEVLDQLWYAINRLVPKKVGRRRLGRSVHHASGQLN